MERLTHGTLATVFAACMIIAPTVSEAYVRVDMSKYNCAHFLAMPPDEADFFAAWLSGWFNQKIGSTSVDYTVFDRNVRNVRKWCVANPKELVMNGIQRAINGN